MIAVLQLGLLSHRRLPVQLAKVSQELRTKERLFSIENGILRGNRKGIGMLWRPFGKQDERLPVCIDHFMDVDIPLACSSC